MTNRLMLLVTAGALTGLMASPALATHNAHHGHRHHLHDGHHKHGKHGNRHIAHKLHHMGFVSWDEIEWDDGYWEVDDARRADGSQYDLKLAPHSLKVVHSRKER